MSSLWWSLRLRREAASVPLARRLLLGSMEAAGVDPEIAFELSLALSEACANAVEHGSDSGGRNGAYCVTAYLDGSRCRIEVADTGPGFPAESRSVLRALEAGKRARTTAETAADARMAEATVGRGRKSGSRATAEQEQAPVGQSAPASGGAPARNAAAEPPAAAEPAESVEPAEAENGRGLFLIESLADHVRFRNRPGRGGAVVSFDKVLKRGGEALLPAS